MTLSRNLDQGCDPDESAAEQDRRGAVRRTRQQRRSRTARPAVHARHGQPRVGPTRPAGLDGTREFLATAGRKLRSDQWQDLVVVAENDRVVQHGLRCGHWPGGIFLGMQVPEGPYAREVVFVYRLVDGRIAERWAVRDDLGMMRQLGALQPG
ncbi:MAG TPA: ester cyclase [Pseudonocardiaceae bacterium]